MAPKTEPIAWERVLVRHVVAARRDDVGRLSSLVRAPFPSSSTATFESGWRDLSLLGPPSGRWMIAARFVKTSWVPLFSGSATGRAIFDANAASRRLEVAWVGCQPGGAGWFVRVHRAGKPVVEFAQPVDAALPSTFRAADLDAHSLDDCEPGEPAFRRLCACLGISLPVPQIQATEQGFLVIGARGKPVKSALRGCVVINGPAITAGEDAAADALAAAIERCDAGGIRGAIERGASLTALPDTSVSPLLSALFRYGRCDETRWRSCLEVLLAGGCPIDGCPPDDPPILDCVQHYVPEPDALKMVEFLVSRGADVNATNSRGETALFESIVHTRMKLVRFLLRHGADPNIRTSQGRSAIEWLRWTLRERYGSPEEAQYARILELLTGSPAE